MTYHKRIKPKSMTSRKFITPRCVEFERIQLWRIKSREMLDLWNSHDNLSWDDFTFLLEFTYLVGEVGSFADEVGKWLKN